MEDIFHLGIKALIRNQQGKILLLKVNMKNLKGYKEEPYWDIHGGRIHKNSTIEDTLKREVKEETGIIDIENITKLDMVLSNNIRIPLRDGSDVGLILSIYMCECINLNNIKLSNEHTEYTWVTPQKASQLLQIKYPSEFTDKIKRLS